MLLTILKYPDPRLRLKAEPVTTFDASLKAIIGNLFETLYLQEGVGLAATQVDIQLRILVIDISPDQKNPQCLINPLIVDEEGEELSEEGCLSFPGIYTKVKRAKKIKTRFMTMDGEEREIESIGLESKVIQHEIDHLNGIVFADRLSPLKKQLFLKKFHKVNK